MKDFPTTIVELRHACFPDPSKMHPRTLWTRFESMFLAHGYTLWSIAPDRLAAFNPPDERVRASDGFFYLWDETTGVISYFSHPKPVLCPARTIDGRDVMIRIVSIGESGTEHRRVLERVATGLITSVAGNHCAPVLEWLTFEDITFAVFPFLGIAELSYGVAFENMRDFLATVEQMFEAVAFCHERLVAHRDIFMGNIITNILHGWPSTLDLGPKQASHVPFRSRFPYKIYLIDFEHAVCFDPDSDPASRVVVGCPGGERDLYAREMPQEMQTDEPHSPFCVDVWQLALYVYDMPVLNIPEALKQLLYRMLQPLPENRPTAQQALGTLRKIISEMPADDMGAAAEFASPYRRRAF